MGKNKESKADAAVLVVKPFLYLGPCSAASSPSFITSQSITHILSIGSTPATIFADIIYHRLSLTDSPGSSIVACSDAADQFIESVASGRKRSDIERTIPPSALVTCKTTSPKEAKILVHCSAAISRSPTIVVAYLMKKQGMTLYEALGLVIRARPTVSPNPGFIRQLKEMESSLFGLETLKDVDDELPRQRKEREAMFACLDSDADSTITTKTVLQNSVIG